MNYDIFLDESELFLESSSDFQKREAYAQDGVRKFPSQIAGIVCREGVHTSGNANAILKSACAAGVIEHQARFHANEYRGKAGFPALGESFCGLSRKMSGQFD